MTPDRFPGSYSLGFGQLIQLTTGGLTRCEEWARPAPYPFRMMGWLSFFLNTS